MPAGLTAGRLAGERDADARLRRLREATRDRVAQRLRPSRPRMRVLRAAPGGRFSWQEVATPPPPGPLAAIVHPIAIATCDMDRVLGLGATPFVLPLHFGHECVAEVLSVGERVTGVSAGERVVVPDQLRRLPRLPPGTDGQLRERAADLDVRVRRAGGHWGGAIADQLLVPYADAMLVPLPAGIDPAAAASTCACWGSRR